MIGIAVVQNWLTNFQSQSPKISLGNPCNYKISHKNNLTTSMADIVDLAMKK
jgi:hypothetical protein